MSAAYVDTSCFVAIAFQEDAADALTDDLAEFDELVSANLLEAELRAACSREKLNLPADFLAAISWVLPDRPLTPEIEHVLTAGYLRGADLWHLAAALYLDGGRRELHFLSLDDAQRKVAKRLGFAVPS